jgi:TolB-like protein/DNA-binding winged helix-turn-helix (wHTH) protein/Tfp pilus assembly protein PilF
LVPRLYRFDDVEVDVQSFRASKAGQALQIEPKALNLLVFLIEHGGRLVGKRELLDAIWNDAFVTENVLTRAIAQLRKALADDAKEPRYIETVPTLGYRFIADLQSERLGKTPVGPTPEILTKHHIGSKRWAMAFGIGLVLVAAGAIGAFWIASRGAMSGSTPIRSLAVLPLQNLSGDPSQDYLADGMTDEIITGLGQISALRVISRTTAMQYRNAHKSLPQIAKELNVDAVVEGSVVRSGDRIRIAAQLFEAPEDRQLWAHSYEGDLRDVLGLQNQVASAVAEEIRIGITPSEKTQLAGTRQVNPRAYEAFLKAESLEEQNTPATWRKALTSYQEAAQLDPNFARAYVGIARCHNYLNGWGVVPAGEATAAADAANAKALELDPELAEAYDERAWTLMFFHWDFPGTERDFRHALELDPGSSDSHDGLADYLVAIGRFDEGFREVKRSLDLDPLSLVVNTDYCRLLRYAHRFDDAVTQCHATLELDPNYTYALKLAAQLYGRKGDYAEAHAIAARLGGCDARCIAMMDEIHGAPGVAGAVDTWLRAQKQPPDAFFLASAFAQLGRKDEAFAWLEKAYEQRDGGNQMIFVAIDPSFDRLHSDPRFDAFLSQAGLPPQPHHDRTPPSQP